MKWKVKPEKPLPQPFDVRYRKKFAFLPQRIEDTYVWLEIYEAKERYQLTSAFGAPFMYYDWVEQ